mmetsp:Transcript_72810/g.128617  ORF Transcript_72810/g.128617 Transcript_72810/m.128617 type:complete len:277 (-) Transcript_72810:243-1073(-)
MFPQWRGTALLAQSVLLEIVRGANHGMTCRPSIESRQNKRIQKKHCKNHIGKCWSPHFLRREPQKAGRVGCSGRKNSCGKSHCFFTICNVDFQGHRLLDCFGCQEPPGVDGAVQIQDAKDSFLGGSGCCLVIKLQRCVADEAGKKTWRHDTPCEEASTGVLLFVEGEYCIEDAEGLASVATDCLEYKHQHSRLACKASLHEIWECNFCLCPSWELLFTLAEQLLLPGSQGFLFIFQGLPVPLEFLNLLLDPLNFRICLLQLVTNLIDLRLDLHLLF